MIQPYITYFSKFKLKEWEEFKTKIVQMHGKEEAIFHDVKSKNFVGILKDLLTVGHSTLCFLVASCNARQTDYLIETVDLSYSYLLVERRGIV